MVALAYAERTLKIAEDERRQFERRPVKQQLPCLRLDHSIEARRNPTLTLDAMDLSDGGLGAISDLPLALGEQVIVRFSRLSLVHQCTVPATVQRCEPTGRGYRIGLMFDIGSAA